MTTSRPGAGTGSTAMATESAIHDGDAARGGDLSPFATATDNHSVNGWRYRDGTGRPGTLLCRAPLRTRACPFPSTRLKQAVEGRMA